MIEQLTYFHFLRPLWLLLIVVALLIYWQFTKSQNVRERYQKLIAPHLLNHLIIGGKKKWSFQPIHMIIIIIIVGAIALAGPTWERELPPFTEDKAPLTIVLSLSETMDAIDISPTRLKRAKQKIVELLQLRSGARTALFVYAESAHMVLPLTTDSKIIELFLSSLASGLMPKDGNNAGVAINLVSQFLIAEEVPGTILFITDGIEKKYFNTISEVSDSSRNQVIVLAVGTSKGAPISIGNNRFLLTKSGQRKIAKMDINGLKQLRDKYNIPITTVSIDNSDVEWIQKNIQTHLQAVQQAEAKTRWIEYGYYLLFPMVLLMLFWFRKGWAVKWVVAVLIYLSAGSNSIYAQDSLNMIVANDSIKTNNWEWFYNLWFTNDQQGRYYFEEDNYEKASEKFEDVMWKGISLYKAKNYEDAINQFALIDSDESSFHLGNSYAQIKNYESAKNSYKEALKKRPDFPEAAYNLRLVEEIIRKIEAAKKKEENEQGNDPTFDPDEIKFDKKKNKGKEGEIDDLKLTPEKMAEIWMRNIQTSPAEFLQRKFYQQAESKK